MTDDSAEDFYEGEDKEDDEALERAQGELRRRCGYAEIEIEERPLFDDEKYLAVGMPNGRDKRWQHLSGLERLTEFLSVPFERYTYLADYVAVCSYEEGTIEAIVRPLRPFGLQVMFRRLLGITGSLDLADEQETKAIELRPDGAQNLVLSLGPVSDEILPLMNIPYRRARQLSIRISGAEISRHDQAVQLLERVANSLFFEIDLTLDVPFALARERRHRGIIRPQRREKPPELEFPKHEYDAAPISLYWYARSAVGMPLLQFLAFYQVIEFYFQTYSQREAGRKIRGFLKDPTFRPDRDSDIGRLLSAIGSSRSGAFGDERTQLRATLQECVDPDSLRRFYFETNERRDFFSAKQKGLTSHKLPLANQAADLRNETADLIYDIRCKIVHTKREDREAEFDLLLPFSPEADLLQHDVELIQYLAQHVLIAASSQLSILE